MIGNTYLALSLDASVWTSNTWHQNVWLEIRNIWRTEWKPILFEEIEKKMRLNVTRQKMEERKSGSIESQYNKMTVEMLQLDSFGTFLLFHRRENSALQHSQAGR